MMYADCWRYKGFSCLPMPYTALLISVPYSELYFTESLTNCLVLAAFRMFRDILNNNNNYVLRHDCRSHFITVLSQERTIRHRSATDKQDFHFLSGVYRHSLSGRVSIYSPPRVVIKFPPAHSLLTLLNKRCLWLNFDCAYLY
jgi:hypothetical protein